MTNKTDALPAAIKGVSLVDGDPDIRHARQIMLRSEHFAVRSYATCAALLADPQSRGYPCIILDVQMDDVDGVDLLAQMRASGWQGSGILLDGIEPDAATCQKVLRNGDRIESRAIGDSALLAAIAAVIGRS